MAEQPDRAVVVGAGMGGLLAARVLSDYFAEVVVVDRDALPSSKQQRRGVPQGRHVHVLLARGRAVLEQHFPGFTEEVVGRGGLSGDHNNVGG
jgi:flavin-dependent dehydrogenase